MENLESAAAEVGGLRLPPNLEPIEVAGTGSHSIIFRANYRGDILAMKVYRPESIERYRKKYDVNIGVYEMSRNRAFRKIPDLLPFTAKPISVMGHDGRCSLIFLQEFVDGVLLTELVDRMGTVPESVLEAGETIVRAAELNEQYELDLHYENVMVRKHSGIWQPVLHDFNHMVKKEEASGSLLGKVFKSGA
jgi:hypothetical protein